MASDSSIVDSAETAAAAADSSTAASYVDSAETAAAVDSSTAASYVDSAAAAETETAVQTVVDYYRRPVA